ncbi:hypothetical protein OK016_28285 [Vibrio chagasii]|nr:hypothetical protein [Vibrio chagasii]
MLKRQARRCDLGDTKSSYVLFKRTSVSNAGVPAIVEKPVTDSIEDAIELLKHANREEAKMLVGHHRAYSPC